MNSIKVLWLVVMVCFAALIYLLFFKVEKIGYVESTRIFQEYKGAKDERAKLEERSNSFKLKIDTLAREVQEAIIKHDGQASESVTELIQLRRKQLEDYQRSVQETLQGEESAAMARVSANLNAFLKEYGKRKGYKFILIANPSGTIAYAEEGTDATDEVIKEINAR